LFNCEAFPLTLQEGLDSASRACRS